MSSSPSPRPGDIILDRYCPDLGDEDREIARARLLEYVAWHMRIIARRLRHEAGDSRDSEQRDMLESSRPAA